jgi:hypothetical protein
MPEPGNTEAGNIVIIITSMPATIAPGMSKSGCDVKGKKNW